MQEAVAHDLAIDIRKLNVWFRKQNKKGETHVVEDITLPIRRNHITAIIGPSGCGKTTILRELNQMNDTNVGKGKRKKPGRRIGEAILYPDGVNLLATPPRRGFWSRPRGTALEPEVIRTRIGMVFQKANPFPKSVFENIAYGVRLHGLASSKGEISDFVHASLEKVGLLKRIHKRLHDDATEFSGGQQQRICIARAIAIGPEVLLMDEPCSALDPKSTAQIENLMDDLKRTTTIVIVTHNMHQAFRVSDSIAFVCQADIENEEEETSSAGRLIEIGSKTDIMMNPRNALTIGFVEGKFG